MGSDHTPCPGIHVPAHGRAVVRVRMTTTVVHDLPHQGNKEGGWTDPHHNEEVHPLEQTW